MILIGDVDIDNHMKLDKLMWKLMMSRIFDINIPINTPRCYRKLINYFALEIVNDINWSR